MTRGDDDPFVRAVPAGETLFSEGDPGEEFFIILDGQVSIRVAGHQVAELGPGEFFGEMAVLDAGPRTATAVTLTRTLMLAVDTARFVFLVTQQPGFALLIMQTLSRRQRGAGRPEAHIAPPPPPRRGSYKAVELTPGVWQLRSRSRSANAYLWRGSDTLALFDTGLGETFPDLEDALGGIGVAPADIDRIVLTHEHFDHWAAAPRLPATDIAALGLAANKLAIADDFGTMRRAFDEEVAAPEVTTILSEGDVIDLGGTRLEVFHAPGHSSGGTAFHDPATAQTIVGDTVLSGGPISGIFGSGSPADLLFALDAITARAPARLLTGHGPVSEAPAEDIAATRARAMALIRDSEAFYDALHANAQVKAVVGAFRDLNRSPTG